MKTASNQRRKISRNNSCPCGSGRKYKNCCDKAAQQRSINSIIALFKELPVDTQVYYLDTCVWSEMTVSEKYSEDFVKFIQTSNCVAAISSYGLFELSRNPNIITDTDSLFYKLRNLIYVPLLYDYVIEAELRIFPKIYKMRWLPLSVVVDKSTPYLLKVLSSKPEFIDVQDGHYQFGLDRFMELEKFKDNFPPIYNEDEYTSGDSEAFVWALAMEYLGRHFPQFLKHHLKSIQESDFDYFDSLLSLNIRSFLVFFKYYLHGQSPEKSDFLDFAHASYAPYCNVYVTERNISNVLKHIKAESLMLSNVEIVHFPKFLAELGNN